MNIEGYQLGREIAVGEYCSIYNALEIDSSKTVTIKYLHSVLSTSEEFCDQFKAATEKLVNRPIGQMVLLKKAVWNEQGCFLITDYFPGGNTQTPLETGFTIGEVLNFGLQISASLTRLHQLGLVHGDISLSNIIFPNLSEVIFGLPAFQRTLETEITTSALQVPLQEAGYLAPEYEVGLQKESDFFSLGVVMFELMFKRKPFTADDHAGLQRQKIERQWQIPKAAYEKLAPLFEQLLNPSPRQRIASVEEYISAVEACSFKLDREAIRKALDNPGQPEPEPAETGKAAITKPAVKTWVLAAVLLLFISAGLFYLFTSEDADQPTSPVAEAAPATPRVGAEEQAAAADQAPVARSPEKDPRTTAQALLQLGQKQFREKKYGAALMTVNKALEEDSGLKPAQQLKRQIEREFETRAALGRAQKQIAEGRILSPPGDNAVQTYRQLAAALPANDLRARNALRKLSDRYYRAADPLVLKQEFPAARRQIETGLLIDPDNDRLQKLALYLRQQETLAVERQKQKIQAEKQAEARKKQQLAERERQAREAQKQQLAEQEKQRRLALQKQQQQRQQALQRQREQQQQQARQKQMVEDRLARARLLLAPQQLSLQSLSQALAVHGELTDQQIADQRIVILYQQILDGYGRLARQQQAQQQLKAALETVRRGLAIERSNPELQNIESEITAEIARAEQRKSVPIIGTF